MISSAPLPLWRGHPGQRSSWFRFFVWAGPWRASAASVPMEAGPPVLRPGQDPPGAGEPAGERAFGDAQLAGRVAPALALQLAQNNRRPVLVRQTIQLVIELVLPVIAGAGVEGFGSSHIAHLSLHRPPPG